MRKEVWHNKDRRRIRVPSDAASAVSKAPERSGTCQVGANDCLGMEALS